jgi:hypothetical protein
VLDVAVPALLSGQPEPLYINFIRRFCPLKRSTGELGGTEKLTEDCKAFLQSPSVPR